MSKGNKLRYYLPAIIWSLLILIVSSIPYLVTPLPKFTLIDKFEHLGEYGILGFLAAYGWFKADHEKALFFVFVFCAVFGILDELHQYWIPGRTVDIFDMLANILGAAAGIRTYIWIKNGLFPKARH